MNAQTKNSKRLWWGIALTVLAILLCYMFVAIYFFFISPNNISLKLTIWPFLSNQAVADLCLDATVEVRVSSNDLQSEQRQLIGVNVREDGFVLVPFHQLDGMEKIQIYANSGKVYDGQTVFCEENFDLAILKCIDADGSAVKMPFVKISSADFKKDEAAISIASPLVENNVWLGSVSRCDVDFAIDGTFEDFAKVDVVVEDGCIVDVGTANAFQDGAVFDGRGNLIGFSFAKTQQGSTFSVLPAKFANLFFDDAVAAYAKDEQYENVLVKSFQGLDKVELKKHLEISATSGGRENSFFFKGRWEDYSTALSDFESAVFPGFFMMEHAVFENGTIPAESVIISATLGRRFIEIASKNDLFSLLYDSVHGQVIDLEVRAMDGMRTSTVRIVV